MMRSTGSDVNDAIIIVFGFMYAYMALLWLCGLYGQARRVARRYRTREITRRYYHH